MKKLFYISLLIFTHHPIFELEGKNIIKIESEQIEALKKLSERIYEIIERIRELCFGNGSSTFMNDTNNLLLSWC